MQPAQAYCGSPPFPGQLLERFNLDPWLITGLLCIASLHCIWLVTHGRAPGRAAAGWSIAAAALISPLCALSVSLFAARVAQHMILLLIAAPLIAASLPSHWRVPGALSGSAASFALLLWFWHMPLPYDATLRSTPIYWTMHLSLFASGVWHWHALLHAERKNPAKALAAGLVTSTQMGLLGAVLSLSSRAWFDVHWFTAPRWGLSPLADQQLGGMLMWVPGGILFFVLALQCFARAWHKLEAMPA